MKKLKFTSDPANKNVNGSTNIIVNNLNNALKKLDLYDDNSLTIHYDCIGNTHGLDPDAMLVVYEMNFPKFILDNLGSKPMIGVSKDNMSFALNAGYNPELCRYVPLGVDTSIWRPVKRTKYQDRFVVLSFSESQTRGGFLGVLDAFTKAFAAGKDDVILYLKDRATTQTFRDVVDSCREVYKVEIILDERDLTDFTEQNQLYSNADLMLYLNHSSTFALTAIQSLSCGCPLMAMPYCGPSEYLTDYNGFKINYDLVEITDDILDRMQQFGLRNYLLPRAYYHVAPYWAQPNIDDVVDKLRYAYNNRSCLNDKKTNAIATAKNFSWERSALNFARTLDEFNL